MSRRLLVLSTTLLSCLPISVERDHPIEGYALNQFDPRHIAATGQIVCAATGMDGPTRCWGALGAPWRTHELPFTIPGEVGLAQVAVSDNWICGLDFDRRALCAGQDPNGALGLSNPVPTLSVVHEGPFLSLKSSSTTTCGLLENGKLVCWGETSYQVFIGLEDSNQRTPFELELDADVTDFDVGLNHLCALTRNPANVVCWGRQTTQSELFPTDLRIVFPDIAPPGPDALCLGEDHACAVLPTGENGAMQVQCWGDNAYGQVQPTSQGGQLSPQIVNLNLVPGRVFCAEYHTCAVNREGRQVECWGKNSDGQLGGELVDGVAKVTVLPNVQEGWFQLVGGEDFTCAVEPSHVGGVMYCWGSNQRGQLGNPEVSETNSRAAVVDFHHDSPRQH